MRTSLKRIILMRPHLICSFLLTLSNIFPGVCTACPRRLGSWLVWTAPSRGWSSTARPRSTSSAARSPPARCATTSASRATRAPAPSVITAAPACPGSVNPCARVRRASEASTVASGTRDNLETQDVSEMASREMAAPEHPEHNKHLLNSTPARECQEALYNDNIWWSKHITLAG